MGTEKNQDKLALKEQKKRQKAKEKNLKYSSPKGVKKRKAKRTVIAVIIIIVVAAIITGIVMCSNGYAHKHITAFTVGDEKFTVADYNYWFQTISTQMMNSVYAYADRDTVIQNATSIISVAKAAEAAGFTLDDADLEQYESTRASLRSDSESYSGGVQSYYNKTYGFATDEEVVMKNYKYQLLAIKYHNDYVSKLNITESDLEEYAENDGREYIDLVTFRYCIFTKDSTDTLGIEYGSVQKTREAAAEFDSKLTGDESSFKNAVYSALEAAGIDTEDYDYDASTLQEDLYSTQMSDELADINEWGFSRDRKAGDHKVFEEKINGQELSYVIYIVTPAHRETYNTVDMRHVLIKSSDETSELSADEQKANAEAKINEIKAEWESGEQTDEAFAELAKKYSEDTTAEYGGLIEKITKGQLVDSINEWLFDESRKAGDYEILESTYGYHLVYFHGTNVEKWQVDARQYLVEDLFSKHSDQLISDSGIKSSRSDFVLSLFADESAEF